MTHQKLDDDTLPGFKFLLHAIEEDDAGNFEISRILYLSAVREGLIMRRVKAGKSISDLPTHPDQLLAELLED